MSAYEIENKVYLQDIFGDFLMDEGEYLVDQHRMSPYEDATIDSMIDPQPHSAGTYPYGYCVTDGGNTYQVNNYSGTSEALVHADWDDLGVGISFTPISTPADLNAVRANQTDRVFGQGTKWQAEYTTTGLAGHYIQVADIDLTFDTQNENGAYYNSGAGWLPIGTFTGVYKNSGKIINGLYINRLGVQYQGLFGIVNGQQIDGIVTTNSFVAGGYQTGTIVGRWISPASSVKNCISLSGVVIGQHSSGVMLGGMVGILNGDIDNCFSGVSVIGNLSRVGGLVGYIGGTGVVTNCISVGRVIASGATVGGLVGENAGTVTASYYNTETSGQSDTGKGVPKTTAELLAGTPSAGIYTDWDERIWDFQAGKYPIHKFFGELGISLPPPTALNATENLGDIDLTWTAPDKEPKGYHVFKSVDDGAWEQVNTELITGTTHSFTPSGTGMYNFFVVAVYYNKVYGANQSTGNSVTSIVEII